MEYPIMATITTDDGQQINLEESYKIAVISTWHMTENDSDMLKADQDCLIAFEDKYSWIVRTWPLECEDNHLAVQARAIDAGFSTAFANTLTFFAKHGYEYLRLDPDGQVVKGLDVAEEWTW